MLNESKWQGFNVKSKVSDNEENDPFPWVDIKLSSVQITALFILSLKLQTD